MAMLVSAYNAGRRLLLQQISIFRRYNARLHNV